MKRVKTDDLPTVNYCVFTLSADERLAMDAQTGARSLADVLGRTHEAEKAMAAMAANGGACD